jgi:hypothetical protein
MTEEELQEKELNKYLGDELRKLSTRQVLKYIVPQELCGVGETLQESIKPYQILLEEDKQTEYLEKVGTILFGNTNVSRPEAEH